MKQITMRQLVRQASEAKIYEWMPCEIVSDGKVIATLIPSHDVRQATKASHDVRQAKIAQFSKAAQIRGEMGR